MNAPALPPGPYAVIYADPPWAFSCWRRQPWSGRGDAHHYSTMALNDIKALPVADIAAADCALFLWATSPMLPEALEVVAAWGFQYKTVAFAWAKTRRSGGWHVGMGYWTRANAEFCLLATRGNPRRVARDVPSLVVAQVGRHSAKPPAVRNRIVRLMGDLPRIELFARERAPGWDVWGNDDVQEMIM